MFTKQRRYQQSSSPFRKIAIHARITHASLLLTQQSPDRAEASSHSYVHPNAIRQIHEHLKTQTHLPVVSTRAGDTKPNRWSQPKAKSIQPPKSHDLPKLSQRSNSVHCRFPFTYSHLQLSGLPPKSNENDRFFKRLGPYDHFGCL
ncbi:hypothetical protein Sinac_3653 [Singulisphaera acidiphila DSM 18658]|uniref:Uncharacterized protein n=1 Tax=Singulisphaera acidiphila (strain ATCC BAA-1392 / DSM 18658 / VKM B-2454 / MOB10) TaxID=886293 RepID=L0DGD5_SINAD|nr:hypothetical protein Sinac_3653 [Singulisphaera acidiphila DSM 18658]